MSRTERVIISVILLFIAVLAIHFLGAKYYAPLAVFDMIIGITIGMVIFIPNNDGSW